MKSATAIWQQAAEAPVNIKSPDHHSHLTGDSIPNGIPEMVFAKEVYDLMRENGFFLLHGYASPLDGEGGVAVQYAKSDSGDIATVTVSALEISQNKSDEQRKSLASARVNHALKALAVH